MLQYLIFPAKPGLEKKVQDTYQVALLIKGKAFREKDIQENYIRPLRTMGVSPGSVVALSLAYNDNDKANVTLIKQHLDTIKNIVDKFKISYLLVADAAYFKVLCKVRKAEPHYGYVLPSIWPGVQASLTVNYQQLFYNPSLMSRLQLGMQALANSVNNVAPIFNEDIGSRVELAQTESEQEQQLNSYLHEPVIALDIETQGLHLKQSKILTYAMAKSVDHAFATPLLPKGIPAYWDRLLQNFLEEYTGTIVYHNCTFDIGRLIYQLFMKSSGDIDGMLYGLHLLFRNFDDTRILTYLATNSAAGNELSLKKLAQEFAGNYALEDIKNPEFIPTKKLLVYNGVDALSTQYVYGLFRQKVQDTQESVYQDLFKPSLKTLCQTELIGMPLNKRAVEDLKHDLNKSINTIQDKLTAMPLVEEFNQYLRVDAAITATAKLKKTIKTADDFADLTFNPGSHKHLQKLLYEHLNLPVLNYTDTNQPSTDGKTLKALARHIKTHYLEE